MGGSKLRKAIGAVKDQTSIGLAKVGSSASISDLDVAIVKATSHEEYPPDERYVREILNLTSYSRCFVSGCVSTIARRLSRTKNWVVALKTLMLIQRLLAEGDSAFQHEIFFATRRGTRLLNMSDFRDTSAPSNSWDYSAFVRTYALYLDEQLELIMHNRRGHHSTYDDDAQHDHAHHLEAPLSQLSNDRVFSKINHLIQLLQRFLACRPTGAAKENRIVSVALYPIVKESFQLCYDITEMLAILIERFMEMELPEMMKVHHIFCRVSKQYDEVEEFYGWCKLVGIARSSECPELEKISQKKLDMMDDYIYHKSVMGRPATPPPEPQPQPQQDMMINSINALPPPPPTPEVVEEKPIEEEQVEEAKTQEEGDLLNLGEDAPTTLEYGDKLALALFDGGLPTTTTDSKATPWEAFDESGDWEMALVQSGSRLSNQQLSLVGGLDTLILNGMYQQGEMAQALASSGVIASGSASSVALGSAGRPSMLALPAPPSAEGGATVCDPFAASLSIAPPSYVEMSEMEKKQKLMVQEQVMWQQYARDGMQGEVGLSKANRNSYPFNTGGHPTTYQV